MADLSNDIRLAVDSGEVVVGTQSVMKSIKDNSAKLVVIAKEINQKNQMEIKHLSKISNIRIIDFDVNSTELGSICGKPFPVSMLSIIKAGNSKILEINKDEVV